MNSTPTIDDLKKIFYSDIYQQTLTDYDKIATHKLDKRDDDVTSFNILSRLERDFKFIGLTTDQVFEHFERTRLKLVPYTIFCVNFFIAQREVDGEFPKGEEQGEENKSITLKVFGMSRTFLLDKFCELYILENMNKDRLLEYLKITRMPGAKKYAGQITKLYKQLA
jgi:hypothetical protein